MDLKQLLSQLSSHGDVLSRLPHLLYAQCVAAGESPQIIFSFNTEPKTRVETFEDQESRDRWWNAFTLIMTKQCIPPCILTRNVLFQPAYLLRLTCHSDERGHFIILDFGNGQNIWCGLKERSAQVETYHAPLTALGLSPGPSDTPTAIQ